MLPKGHVFRPRLTDAIRAARVAVVVAPAGFGKTSLAAEFVEGLAGAQMVWVPAVADAPARTVAALLRALRAARVPLPAELAGAASVRAANGASVSELTEGLADALVAALESHASPVVIVVDDAHNAPSELIVALAQSVPSPHHIVFLARRALLVRLPVAVAIGADELALTRPEIDLLLGTDAPPNEADAVIRATSGWPAAVAIATEPGRASAASLLRSDGLESFVGTFVAGLLAATSRPEIIGTLARLPMITPSVADALGGPATWEGLLEGGLPVARDPDGTVRVPRAVAERIIDTVPVDRDLLVTAGLRLAAEGAPLAAVDVLSAAGARREAAHLLAEIPGLVGESISGADWRALFEMLGDEAIAQEPMALVQAARSMEVSVELVARAQLIARAAALARDLDVVHAVEAEQVRDLVLGGFEDEAITRGTALLASLDEHETRTKIRCLAALGRLAAWSKDRAGAERMLSDAAALAGRIGETAWHVQILCWLGYGVHLESGDRLRALATLNRAVALSPSGSSRDALASVLLAEAHTTFGDAKSGRAVLGRVAETLAIAGDERLRAYRSWQLAACAALEGDVTGVAIGLVDVERHPGEWFAHPTGIEFLAAAADLSRRVGDFGAAHTYLERASERAEADGLDAMTLFVGGALAAQVGDAAAADALLDAAAQSSETPQREQWRIALLRGYAARRRGETDHAQRWLDRARVESATIAPDIGALIEPVIWREMHDRRDARDTGEAPTRTPPTQDDPRPDGEPRGRHVRVFGGFEVFDAGHDVTPAGQSAALVKFIALERAVPTERVVETFWPEVDPDIGRRRLRNLLNRVRDQCGDIVVRNDDAVTIARDVEVDVVTFEHLAGAALTDGDDDAARRAISKYRGDVLPLDVYEDWTAPHRSSNARRCCDVIDALARRLADRGEYDAAIVVLERALEIDPYDDARWLRAARLAATAKQRGRARSLLQRCVAALDEIGVEPHRDHAALLASL